MENKSELSKAIEKHFVCLIFGLGAIFSATIIFIPLFALSLAIVMVFYGTFKFIALDFRGELDPRSRSAEDRRIYNGTNKQYTNLVTRGTRVTKNNYRQRK